MRMVRLICIYILILGLFLTGCGLDGSANSNNSLSANSTTVPCSTSCTGQATTPPTTVHIHFFVDATCIAPRTCSACGAAEGDAIGHSWCAATCTTPKTCSICNEVSGNPAGHKWTSATCTSPKTCNICSITEGSPTGHRWKDATYVSPKRCSSCGTTVGSPLAKPGGSNYHGHVYTGGSSSKKFHYEAQCAGKYSHEITWDEVERRGLGPCGTCVLK